MKLNSLNIKIKKTKKKLGRGIGSSKGKPQAVVTKVKNPDLVLR